MDNTEFHEVCRRLKKIGYEACEYLIGYELNIDKNKSFIDIVDSEINFMSSEYLEEEHIKKSFLPIISDLILQYIKYKNTNSSGAISLINEGYKLRAEKFNVTSCPLQLIKF